MDVNVPLISCYRWVTSADRVCQTFCVDILKENHFSAEELFMLHDYVQVTFGCSSIEPTLQAPPPASHILTSSALWLPVWLSVSPILSLILNPSPNLWKDLLNLSAAKNHLNWDFLFWSMSPGLSGQTQTVWLTDQTWSTFWYKITDQRIRQHYNL